MTNYLSPSCFIFWMGLEHAIILTPLAPQLFDDNLAIWFFGTPQTIPFLARGHTILEGSAMGSLQWETAQDERECPVSGR